jgi:beta-glucosidase
MTVRTLAWLMMLAVAGTVWAQAPAPAVEPTAPVAPSVPAAETRPATDGSPAAAEEKKPNAAIVPVARVDNERWIARNQEFVDRAKQGAEQGDIEIIFMGDSITQQWETAGEPVWREFYSERKVVNFGIGGDRTQHLLWRIQNGNVEGLAKPKAGHAPRLVVMMIGTNNSNGDDHTAAEIAEGIKACVTAVRERLPETKVLLLSIFPRGETPSPQREKNAEASRLAAAIADDKMVFHLDLTDRFVEPDGTIKKEIMPDFLHLSEEGYRRWASGMEAKLAELLGEGE